MVHTGQPTATEARRRGFAFAKRVIDIIFASLLTPVFVFVLPLMWIASRIEGYPSLLYFQQRIGLNGETIDLPKFRTIGPGRGLGPAALFLRAMRNLGLDELPQVFLVFRGRMSCVGPRPLVREDLHRYCTPDKGFLAEAIRLRQTVKPGITGFSQVHLRSRDRSGYLYWVMLGCDLWYVRNCSVGLDLGILAFTPLYLLSAGRLLLRAGLVTSEVITLAAATNVTRVIDQTGAPSTVCEVSVESVE